MARGFSAIRVMMVRHGLARARAHTGRRRQAANLPSVTAPMTVASEPVWKKDWRGFRLVLWCDSSSGCGQSRAVAEWPRSPARPSANAVRYLVRSGCGWRMLPVHFGAWQTVYGWFRELARRFLFQTIHD